MIMKSHMLCDCETHQHLQGLLPGSPGVAGDGVGITCS